MALIKCLSIKQPWAHLILQGIKDCENRAYNMHHRGPLLIHVSKSVDEDAIPRLRAAGYEIPASLTTGTIAGIVNVVDCRPPTEKRSGWHQMNQYGLYFDMAFRFPEPIPFKGRLGFFDVRLSVVEEQIRACKSEVGELVNG